MSEATYSGGCFCGEVRFSIRGPVRSAQVCHCSICRQLQGSSLGQLAAFFNVDDFKIEKGADKITTYLSPLKYSRNFCSTCGSRVNLSFEKADMEIPFVVVYPTMLDELKSAETLPDEFRPARHIFYADRLYDNNDGIPKFVDMPAEFGGSGKVLNDNGSPA